MRSGIRGMGFGPMCALPNMTSRQAGMGGIRGMGLDIDWTALGQQLLQTAGQVAGQYAPQQQQQPTVIYQQVPAQQQQAPSSGTNTVLWVAGGLAAAGLIWWLASSRRGH